MITNKGMFFIIDDNGESHPVGHTIDINPFELIPGNYLNDDIINEILKPLPPKDLSCTFSGSINKDMLNKMYKSLPEPNPKWDMIFETKVQRRKHRKKRINKKWAKRYGFKTVYKKYAVDISKFSNNPNAKPFNPNMSEVTATLLLDESKLTGELYSNIKI